MAEPFLAEIRVVSFSFAPKGWALCNGQLLPINQNQALFSLLGTTYGGDGRVNFALPNFQGRVPMHTSNTHTLGERGGELNHTLSAAELPAHTHSFSGSSAAASGVVPTGSTLAATRSAAYASPGEGAASALAPGSMTSVGGNQPHNNAQPSLALNFVIALQGIFPSQN